MNRAARQLLLLAAALTFMALLIGGSAFVSWREIRELRRGFTTSQLESFRIADQLQAGLLKLDALLLKYSDGRLPEDWRSFTDESRRLDAWIDQQKAAFDDAGREGGSQRGQCRLRRVSRRRR